MRRSPNATLTIHVQPRAKRTEVVGWHGDAIKIRLAAPPVDGSANEELQRFLADALGVPRQAVALTSGQRSRRKRVEITGCDPREALRSSGSPEPAAWHPRQRRARLR